MYMLTANAGEYNVWIRVSMLLCCCFVGNNESHGMRKDITLHLDMDLEDKMAQSINLHTPPRHLTIEEAFTAEAKHEYVT